MLWMVGSDGIACDGTRDSAGAAQTSDRRNKSQPPGALPARNFESLTLVLSPPDTEL